MKKLPEVKSSDIQLVVDRLAKARWINRAGVSEFETVVDFSGLGHSRMLELAMQFRAAVPASFGLPRKRASLRIVEKIKLVWLFIRALSELMPPYWKKGEGNVFTSFVIIYALSPERFLETSSFFRFRSQAPPSSL